MVTLLVGETFFLIFVDISIAIFIEMPAPFGISEATENRWRRGLAPVSERQLGSFSEGES